MEIKEWSELEGTLTKEKQIYDIGGDCLLNTALVTVIHDPEGKSIQLFKEHKKELEQIYSKLFIAISEETSRGLITEIEKVNLTLRLFLKKE